MLAEEKHAMQVDTHRPHKARSVGALLGDDGVGESNRPLKKRARVAMLARSAQPEVAGRTSAISAKRRGRGRTRGEGRELSERMRFLRRINSLSRRRARQLRRRKQHRAPNRTLYKGRDWSVAAPVLASPVIPVTSTSSVRSVS